jgi:hypothetical protein
MLLVKIHHAKSLRIVRESQKFSAIIEKAHEDHGNVRDERPV